MRACGSMTPTRTNTCSMIGLTISRTVTKWMPSAGSGVKRARRVRAVVGRSLRMAKMANRWQMLWQTHGKPIANAMANRWQTHGKTMANRWQTHAPYPYPYPYPIRKKKNIILLPKK